MLNLYTAIHQAQREAVESIVSRIVSEMIREKVFLANVTFTEQELPKPHIMDAVIVRLLNMSDDQQVVEASFADGVLKVSVTSRDRHECETAKKKLRVYRNEERLRKERARKKRAIRQKQLDTYQKMQEEVYETCAAADEIEVTVPL